MYILVLLKVLISLNFLYLNFLSFNLLPIIVLEILFVRYCKSLEMSSYIQSSCFLLIFLHLIIYESNCLKIFFILLKKNTILLICLSFCMILKVYEIVQLFFSFSNWVCDGCLYDENEFGQNTKYIKNEFAFTLHYGCLISDYLEKSSN